MQERVRDIKGKNICKTVLFVAGFIFVNRLILFCLNDDVNSFARLSFHAMYDDNKSKVVIVGSSPVLCGVNPYVLASNAGLPQESVLSMGTNAQLPIDTYFLMREAIKVNHPDTVIINIAYQSLAMSSPEGSYGVFPNLRWSVNKLEYMLNAFEPDEYFNAVFDVRRYAQSSSILRIPHTLHAKLAKEYWTYDDIANYSGDTLLYVSQGNDFFYWYGTNENPKPREDQWQWTENELNQEQVMWLKKSIAYCQEKGIDVMLCSIPLSMTALLTETNYNEPHNYIMNIADEFGIAYWDMNLIKSDILYLEDCDFKDNDHLNGQGANKLSAVLGELLELESEKKVYQEDYFYSTFEERLCYE